MSYLDDFNENMTNTNKIPYDDIPITRNASQKRSPKEKFTFSGNRFLVYLVAVLFCVNVVLCGTLFYYLKHGKIDEINVYHNNINASEESVSAIASNKALKSAVNVAAGGDCNDEESFYNNNSSKGAGVIHSVDETAKIVYFVTCYHVVDVAVHENSSQPDGNVWIMLPSSLTPVKVQIVSYSKHYDIAVLKYKYAQTDVNSFLRGCLPVEKYDTTYLSVSETVYAIGNPLSLGFRVVKGSISWINILTQVESNGYKTREIQIDAPINRGNSGGGLFNAYGQFIGLVNSRLIANEVDGIAYAIPGNLVMGIADSIIKNNKNSADRKPATFVEFGLELGHANAGFVEESYNDETKTLLTYDVEVTRVYASSILKDVLEVGDVIEAIEFTCNGSSLKTKVNMINKYIFEDYGFAIAEDTEIVIYYKKGGRGETLNTKDENKRIFVEKNDYKSVN